MRHDWQHSEAGTSLDLARSTGGNQQTGGEVGREFEVFESPWRGPSAAR